MESAWFVIARGGRTPPLSPPHHGCARFPALAAWSVAARARALSAVNTKKRCRCPGI